MKHMVIILLAWLGINQASQGIFICKNVKISLFSEAPLENIDANSTKGTSVFNASTGDLAFTVPIRSLEFQKSLMQEHFNENYMESDKYPNASFKGKISGTIDVSKNGSYPVNASGILEVHGVKQNRTIPGKITVNNGVLTISSAFTVNCKDHNITIPKLVFKKIAETIKVNVDATYSAYKNKTT